MLFFVCKDLFFFAEKFRPGEESAKRDQNREHYRRDQKDPSRFRLKAHRFIARRMVKMFSDIR